jgi:hypothetical protein
MPDDVAHDLSRMKFVPRQGTFIPSNPVKKESVPCYATSERKAGMPARLCPAAAAGALGRPQRSAPQAAASGDHQAVASGDHEAPPHARARASQPWPGGPKARPGPGMRNSSSGPHHRAGTEKGWRSRAGPGEPAQSQTAPAKAALRPRRQAGPHPPRPAPRGELAPRRERVMPVSATTRTRR